MKLVLFGLEIFFEGLLFSGPEEVGSTVDHLLFPVRNLGGMDLELLGDLRGGLDVLEGLNGGRGELLKISRHVVEVTEGRGVMKTKVWTGSSGLLFLRLAFNAGSISFTRHVR